MNTKCRDYTRILGMCLAVFVMISVFFYAPMEVRAGVSESVEDSEIALLSVDSTTTSINNGYYRNVSLVDSVEYDFSSYMADGDGLYKITCTIVPIIETNVDTWWNALTVYFNAGELYQQSSVTSTGSYVTDYSWTTTRVFYLDSSATTMRVSYKGVANFGSTKPSSFTVNCSYTVSGVTAERISVEDSEQYNAGYSAGYKDGEDVGYDNGYSSGYNSGYTAGQDSVDTDAYYQDGYDAGYSVAYDAGYDAGYDEAYDLGYATAMETLEKGGSAAGTATKINKSVSVSNSSLDIEDVNTLLPTIYHEWKDFEYEYTGTFDEVYESYYGLDFDGDGVYDNWSTNTDGSFSSSEIYSLSVDESGAVGFGYYLADRQKLFTASQDAYAYKVTIKQSSTSYTGSNIKWARCVVGQSSELLETGGDLGFLYLDGGTSSYTFFIQTNNLPLDIYTGVLFYFYDTDDSTATYSLNSSLTIEYTPYARTEYNAIVDSIDNIANGYDSSAGDSMNADFSSGVNDYQIAEDSLFTSAKSNLEDFEFFNFDSVPAVITGLSFVGALMTSIFSAMGGLSGGGIVLSVLFSVMLIAMIVGLYKFYTSSGDDGDDIGDPPNHVPRIGLKK